MPRSRQTSLPLDDLKPAFKGAIRTDSGTLKLYSHDTSVFELIPQAVIFPKDVKDLQTLVNFTNRHKKFFPTLSLTARSAGSGMTGGSINQGLIVDFKHFNRIGTLKQNGTWIEPGVFYRDFENYSLKHRLIYPVFPASKNLCAFGGIVANNAAGEKSLKYGQTVDFVTQIKAILRDGKQYHFKALNQRALKKKLRQKDFEGQIYRQLYQLLEKNYQLIQKSKPRVSKNSTGYFLWDVWDKKTFNLAKLLVGSQGTLGLITNSKIRLVPTNSHHGLLVVYLNDLQKIPQLINHVLATNPDAFEAFDHYTLKLALRFMPQFIRLIGPRETILMGIQFLPQLASFIFHGLPQFTFLIEYEADSQDQINQKIDQLQQSLTPLIVTAIPAKTPNQAERYKTIRRESFNLLRKNVKDKHSAAFIDDFIIPPHTLPEFSPRLIHILNQYKLTYTIAGHMGDGNFHIIPLMDLSKDSERAKIPPLTRAVNRLVLEFRGSISAEHNEGLIRGPFVKQMYGPKMFALFKKIKKIFDPDNIFNPHKKVDADMKFSMSHLRRTYDQPTKKAHPK